MSSVITQTTPRAGLGGGTVVNDFSLQVATANGSGSQTANNVLMRAIFRMGVPVSGKNLFPSNIQGLPTWFTIRASRDGYVARKRELDVLVLMNPETADEDVRAARPGAHVVCEKKLGVETKRSDLTFYPVPFSELVVKVTAGSDQAKLRKLIVNMIYVGVVADLMGIDPGEVEAAIRKQLKGKQKAIDLNLSAVRLGLDYAAASFPAKIPYRVERMDATQGKIIVEGNVAAALGSLFGGATVCCWYPITPSSSLCEAFIEFCDRHRVDPASGKKTVAVVQAEDEIASIGMVLGAGWAGARAFTATSGPGVSLMSEFLGLGYYVEVPAVVWDVQRVGPSTGLPTRTQQGDLLLAHYNSHGDTKHPVLFPADPGECFEMAMDAFDLAEELQTPVFVLSDLDLGMNSWMSDPFPYPARERKRGKVLDETSLREMTASWGRYKDVDGDGIPWRTLPGTPSPRAAYLARGSGHNAMAQYSEKPHDYVANVDRLARKLETARGMVPKPRIEDVPGADGGLVAFGTSHHGTSEARDRLAREAGVPLDYLRLRALPPGPEVREWLDRHERIYVVEQNRDGQLRAILRDEYPDLAARFVSVLQYDGLPLDATTVVDGVLADRAARERSRS
ncbi:MAG TPA: 2-oxoacid:acceptor oxidoreductase subunit alpha [Thermoanaerobaculia bacterium]|nr:2-oxoacid:acceptor oxidoreductase subunit alpha [Thermoanaerobaculia bacterium]HQR67065.1 2-oxoacid:acceptor oxidoreductase subunit alpha [Thermoanaerobaculia bacterium]